VKNLFLVLIGALLLAACKPSTEQAVEEVSEYSVYGDESITPEEAVSMEVLLAKLNAEDSVAIKMTGAIEQTCTKMGCWMTVDMGNGETLRVTFKDYGFFVPKEGMEGKEVVFEGIAKRKVTDVDMLKHFAEDAGKSQEEIDAITEPKVELSFVASGVLIKDKES
jgi:hypothetical protein